MTNTNKKFAFGAAPKEFTKAVGIVLVTGEVAEINFTFIYRTRAEFAALVDENMVKAQAEADAADKAAAGDGAAPAPRKTMKDLYDQIDKIGVDYVLKIAKGWDLSDTFDAASLQRLENENPGSLNAISTVYRMAVAEVRTKN